VETQKSEKKQRFGITAENIACVCRLAGDAGSGLALGDGTVASAVVSSILSVPSLPFRLGVLKLGIGDCGGSNPFLFLDPSMAVYPYAGSAWDRYCACKVEADDLNPWADEFGSEPLLDALGRRGGFLPVEDLLGEYLPDENKIVVHMGAVREFSREVQVPAEIMALVVAAHEAAHAFVHAAFPCAEELPEDVGELLADTISGTGLRLASAFGLPALWDAWAALDRCRFEVAAWAEDFCLIPEGLVYMVASVVPCCSRAGEAVALFSGRFAENLKRWKDRVRGGN
jgi:hypothetical protein